jgi:hypothetical protein
MFSIIRKDSNKNLIFLCSMQFLLVIIIFSNCKYTLEDSREEYQITGRIVDVESYSLTIANKLSLQSGNVISDYVIEATVGDFTPSHIRNHMLTGDIVKIIYVVSNNQNIIIHIEDYD